MSQSGRNTSIAPSKLGPIRMPSDGDKTATGPGPVVIYHLSPEEIAARYGPPVVAGEGVKIPQRKGNKGYVVDRLQQGKTLPQIAAECGLPLNYLEQLIEEWGIRVKTRENRKGEKEVRGDLINAAMKALPKEKFAEMVAAGKTDQQVAEESGVSLETVKRLKKKYGLTRKGLIREGHKPVKCEYCSELKQVQESVSNLMAWVDKHAAGGENYARYDAEAKLLSIMGSITQVGVDKFDPERDLTSEDYRCYKALEILVLYIIKPDLDALDEINDDMAERIGKLEEHARHHAHQVQNGLWSGKAVV